jgi:hypothetical protein
MAAADLETKDTLATVSSTGAPPGNPCTTGSKRCGNVCYSFRSKWSSKYRPCGI